MGTTATQRVSLAAALRTQLVDLQGLVVIDHSRVLDDVTAPTLLVLATGVAPGVVPGVRRHTLEVWVIEPSQIPGPMDDGLDDLFDIVLTALEEGETDAVFTSAERTTYASGHPAWRITCTRED